MSNIQIPNLPAAIALIGTEQLEAVQAGSSVRVNMALLGAYLNTVYPITLSLGVGTTGIVGGGTGNILFDDGGVLGELSTIPVANGGTGVTGFGVVTSKTANYVVLTADSYKDFDNNGASGTVTFTLPAASVGLAYGFAVMEAFDLVIQAPGGVTLYAGAGSASTAGGTLTSSDVGSYILLKCRSSTEWFAQQLVPSWTPA